MLRMNIEVFSFDPHTITSPDDAELYYDTFKLYQNAFYPETELEDYLFVTDEVHIGLVGKIAGKTVCMALLSWASSIEPENQEAAELTHLAVESRVRGHGVGAKFLKMIESTVLEAGNSRLDVIAFDDRSFDFYCKNGYQPLVSVPRDYRVKKQLWRVHVTGSVLIPARLSSKQSVTSVIYMTSYQWEARPGV